MSNESTCSKQAVEYQLVDGLSTINCTNALENAIKSRKYPERSLIHHYDRGFQYCSPDYPRILDDNDIGISITTKYDPYESPVAERINRTIRMNLISGTGSQIKSILKWKAVTN